MSESVKKHVIASIRSLMKPIILLLQRNGVTYKEFALLCKSIFVEAAAEEYGIRGRPTNVSRISVLTGIDRKEVKRIKDQLLANDTAEESAKSRDRFTRILSGWYQNTEFCDAKGKPKTLPIVGDTCSFTALIKRYGGDVPVQAILKEMARLKLVDIVGDQVTALSRDYFPAQNDPEALLRASSVIAELSETLFHNLYVANPNKKGSKNLPRFERRASNNFMSRKHQKAFYKKLEEEGQQFLEAMDAWMTEREQDIQQNDQKTPAAEPSQQALMRFSVGLFGYDKEQIESGDDNEDK